MTAPMWWWKVAQHLDSAQLASVNAMAHNLDDQTGVFAFQDKLREAQALLLEIFRAKGLLPGAINGAAPPLSSVAMDEDVATALRAMEAAAAVQAAEAAAEASVVEASPNIVSTPVVEIVEQPVPALTEEPLVSPTTAEVVPLASSET